MYVVWRTGIAGWVHKNCFAYYKLLDKNVITNAKVNSNMSLKEWVVPFCRGSWSTITVPLGGEREQWEFFLERDMCSGFPRNGGKDKYSGTDDIFKNAPPEKPKKNK